jgi:hypothetical protein
LGVVLVACVLAAGSAVSAEKALSYPKGHGLRIVSTGHSWVAPAMKTLSPIALAAGFDGHHLLSHLNGGGKGSVRSIWAAEKGLDYPGRAKDEPKRTILLPAIETGQWDVMTWGAFTWDKPEDYTNWIDVCLKANPGMVFYVQDGWPRAQEGMTVPGTYDIKKFLEAQLRINEKIKHGVDALNAKYPGKIHVIPMGDGICELLRLLLDKQLPYVQKVDSQKQAVPGIYKDGGHLDEKSGLDWFEGYVYYATLYKRSPELIKGKFKVPDDELDKVFRKVAWQVVTHHPLSGVTDRKGSGIGDQVK